jgi:threonine/homoserine/homoserine lactone efflux protein
MKFARLHGLPPVLSISIAVLVMFGTIVYSVIFWQIRHRRKYAQKPEYEATLNRVAVVWLHKHDDWDKEQLLISQKYKRQSGV